MGRPANTLQRLETRVEKITESGCWIWMGPVNRDGYGKVGMNHKHLRRHRAFYEGLVGPIPSGMQLDHVCLVRCCVRPDHMRLATARENTLAPGSEAITKRLGAKTHCPQGHEYSPENTYVSKGPRRHCRACANERG